MLPYNPPPYSTLRNQLPRRIEQYLNTLGNWNTYRSATTAADVVAIVVKTTTAFFGLTAGTEKAITGATVLGAVMALHALERLTGAAATLAVRLTWRQPARDWHRGIAVRTSPFDNAWALKWLLGSRLQKAWALYFHQGGITWHYQVIKLGIWNESRTLAHLRSFSLPHRSYFFDRDIGWQIAIEVTDGLRLPDRIVGYLGGINELEAAAGLPARIKLAYIAANWLLIDPDERAQIPPTAPAGPSNTWTTPQSSYYSTQKGGYTPSQPPPAVQLPLLHAKPNGATPPPPPPSTPAAWIKERYAANGRSYPLLVKRILTNPITLVKSADAIYYDDADHTWKPVPDPDRAALANEVVLGRLPIAPNWEKYL